MIKAPEGIEVVLRNLRPQAPLFHRHIVRRKLLGAECRAGDHVVTFEVAATVPAGPVRVTADTMLRFE